MTGTNQLTRRRVLGGVATVGAASAAVGAGTFAYFSDTESSDDNAVTAGTLDLTGTTDGVVDVTDAVPGQRIPETGATAVRATYDSASSVEPVEVDLGVAVGEPADEPTEPDDSTDQSASAFAQQLTVETASLTVNGGSVEDLTSTQSVATADDLNGLTLDAAYGGVSPGDTVGLELAFTFDSGADNAYQADGVSLDVTFTAEQPAADS